MENVQVYPTRQRITLNDKATKILFNLTPEKFTDLLNGNTRRIVEKKSYKKQGKVKSGYRLQNEEGYTNIAPIDEYDRAALDTILSEYEEGNTVISLAMIQRALSGKNCQHTEGVINKKQLSRLKQAVDKLMCTQYDPDILQAFEKLDYEGAEEIRKAPILPCKRIRKTINGNGKNSKEDLICIYDESPLLKIAKLKGQILTYDADLLDVPNQNNTPLVIMLKNYTLRRVLECIKHSKQLKPILTLDDIFSKCRINDADKSKRQDARAILDKFFAHLQEKKLIKSYEFTKKGNQFYSIKFTY